MVKFNFKKSDNANLKIHMELIHHTIKITWREFYYVFYNCVFHIETLTFIWKMHALYFLSALMWKKVIIKTSHNGYFFFYICITAQIWDGFRNCITFTVFSDWIIFCFVIKIFGQMLKKQAYNIWVINVVIMLLFIPLRIKK
jgi:hypothetical protein